MPKEVTKKFSIVRVLMLIFVGLLSLGQFQRFQITPTSAVYVHELLIGVLFCVALAQPNAVFFLKKFLQTSKPLIFFISILGLSLVINTLRLQYNPIIPALYFLRLILYTSLIPTLVIFHQSGLLKKSNGQLLIILGICLAVGGLIQYLFFPDARSLTLLGWDDHLYRSIGTLLDPNFLGIMMVLALLVAINTKVQFQKIVIMILAACLLLTYSRASFLAMLAAFLVWGAQTKRVAKMIIVAAAFLLVIVILPRRGGEGNRLERMFSISQRLESFQNGLGVFKLSPLIGVGYNAYPNYLPLAPKYNFIPAHPSSPDNSYLLILATSGLIGAFAFLNLTWKMLTKWRHHPIILPSLIAVGVHATFNNTIFFPWVMAWLAILIAQNDKH